MEQVFVTKLEALVSNLYDIYEEVTPFHVFQFDKQFEEDINDIYNAVSYILQNAYDEVSYSALDAKIELTELSQAIDTCLNDYHKSSAWYKIIHSMQDKINGTIRFMSMAE